MELPIKNVYFDGSFVWGVAGASHLLLFIGNSIFHLRIATEISKMKLKVAVELLVYLTDFHIYLKE